MERNDGRPASRGVRPQGTRLSGDDFDYVRELVRKRSAIALEAGKEYLATSRLEQLAQREGLDSVDSLLRTLRRGDERIARAVVEAMTTNETSFYRDRRPFEALRADILPRLIEARRASRRLVLWCAAASSGQEPYSVRMLLDEHFPELATWDVELLATDLSQDVLARAQEGLYTQFEVDRGLSPRLLAKHFDREGNRWRAKRELRERVRFRAMNLAEPWPVLEPCDVVLARNVLLYFDAAAKSAVLGRIRRVLRPDGVLLLGGAESTVGLDDAFVPVRSLDTTYYRLAAQAA